MEQEVKLFHVAKLLQQLHQVIPARRGDHVGKEGGAKKTNIRGSEEEEE